MSIVCNWSPKSGKDGYKLCYDVCVEESTCQNVLEHCSVK